MASEHSRRRLRRAARARHRSRRAALHAVQRRRSRCATRPPPARRAAPCSTCRAPARAAPGRPRRRAPRARAAGRRLPGRSTPRPRPATCAPPRCERCGPWTPMVPTAKQRGRSRRRAPATRGAATTRSSSAWPRASARPTACCRRATPSRRPGATSSSGCSRPTAARRRRRWPRGCRSCRGGASTYRGTDLERHGPPGRSCAARPSCAWSTSSRTPTRPGLEHDKRYEDIEDLLDAGIDVLSTVNVQHLESLNDQVAELSGVRVRETVPDSVLGRADEVVLIDLTPEALLARLRAGKVYPPERIDAALNGFFRIENLAALREVALRQVAAGGRGQAPDDRGRRHREDSLAADLAQAVGERLLALVEPYPGSQRLVRRAWRSAQRLGAQLDLLWVAPPGREPDPDAAAPAAGAAPARLGARRQPARRARRRRRRHRRARRPRARHAPTSSWAARARRAASRACASRSPSA